MVDVRALKAEMVRKGYNNEALAKEIGITPRTFSTRLRKRDFGVKEIEIIMKTLDIVDPVPIFFAN